MAEVEQLAKKKSRMEEVDQLATSTDPLLSCCICRRLLNEPVQLKCLHSCCRQCFSSAESTAGVSCVACGAIAEAGSEQPNRCIDGQVPGYRANAESRVCHMCKGEHDKSTVKWCMICRRWLCGECKAGHRPCSRRQAMTRWLEKLSYQDEMCEIHRKRLDIACHNCEQVKCLSCWDVCKDKKHKMLLVGKEAFDTYVGTLIVNMSSIGSELLQKSEVLEKPKSYVQEAKVACDRHLEEIAMSKRRVMDAVEMVYQEIATATKSAYDELVAERAPAVAVSDRIGAELSDALTYISRLVWSRDKRKIFNQQKIVRERHRLLSSELDSLCDHLAPAREVLIESSLPDNLEDVIRTWMGKPRLYAVSVPPPLPRHESFSFGACAASFKLPVSCKDVALTQDGRSLLLAAWHHGLIELNSTSGRKVSSWRPPKHNSTGWDDSVVAVANSTGWDDSVVAVAALSGRRAAVSLHLAQLIVLLRRNKNGSGARRRDNADSSSSSSRGEATAASKAASDGTWSEDRRFQLNWCPCWLSVYGDVLAVCDRSWGLFSKPCEPGRLRLLSLSGDHRLSDVELHRDYGVGSLAVAAGMVVTGSEGMVQLGDGCRAGYVLDAHSLDADGGSDKRLWRHALSGSIVEENERLLQRERLYDVFADPSGGCLYAACDSNRGGRVCVLSLADGSELRRVALSFHWPAGALPRPRRLTLCRHDGAAEQHGSSSTTRGDHVQLLLAVLCYDDRSKENFTLTLHRNINDIVRRRDMGDEAKVMRDPKNP